MANNYRILSLIILLSTSINICSANSSIEYELSKVDSIVISAVESMGVISKDNISDIKKEVENKKEILNELGISNIELSNHDYSYRLEDGSFKFIINYNDKKSITRNLDALIIKHQIKSKIDVEFDSGTTNITLDTYKSFLKYITKNANRYLSQNIKTIVIGPKNGNFFSMVDKHFIVIVSGNDTSLKKMVQSLNANFQAVRQSTKQLQLEFRHTSLDRSSQGQILKLVTENNDKLLKKSIDIISFSDKLNIHVNRSGETILTLDISKDSVAQVQTFFENNKRILDNEPTLINILINDTDISDRDLNIILQVIESDDFIKNFEYSTIVLGNSELEISSSTIQVNAKNTSLGELIDQLMKFTYQTW